MGNFNSIREICATNMSDMIDFLTSKQSFYCNVMNHPDHNNDIHINKICFTKPKCLVIVNDASDDHNNKLTIWSSLLSFNFGTLVPTLSFCTKGQYHTELGPDKKAAINFNNGQFTLQLEDYKTQYYILVNNK